MVEALKKMDKKYMVFEEKNKNLLLAQAGSYLLLNKKEVG